MTELDDIENDYLAIIESSRIVNIDLNRGSSSGMVFIGFAQWGWAPSSEPEQADRMRLLGRVRDFRPRFLLLFPHPTPEIEKRHREALDLLERWLARADSDHSLPSSTDQVVVQVSAAVADLRKARNLLPTEDFAVHVVVDTNALLDDPDLARFVVHAGPRYLVHLLPVVLREIDDHKRAGRNQDLRDAARRATGG